MATDLHDLSIAELSGLIAARKLSPVELADALIRRVEDYDEQTHAFITRTFELARRQAKEAEGEIAAGRLRGPLHGIPFGLKDIYDTRGILTSGHSRVFIDRVPSADATATTKLYEAGAVLLASSPRTRWRTRDRRRSAVAAGAQPWSLAHFTVARRRVGRRRRRRHAAARARLGHGGIDPRAGVALWRRRLMPTFGLVIARRHHQLVHVRPLRTAGADGRGLRACLQTLAGYDPKDAGSLRRSIPPYREALGQDLKNIRIGVLRHHWEADMPASEDVRRAMDAALDVLRRLGAQLEECRVRPLASYFDVKIIIAESEIFAVHQKNLVARPKDFGADFRSRTFPSVLFTAHDYVQATREHRRMMLEMQPLYARFDAFVTASLGEAPRLADYRSVSFWQKPSLLTAWNVTGQPVLQLPNGADGTARRSACRCSAGPSARARSCASATPTSAPRTGTASPAARARGARAPTWCRRRCCRSRGRGRRRDAGSVREGGARAGLQLDDLMLAQLLKGRRMRSAWCGAFAATTTPPTSRRTSSAFPVAARLTFMTRSRRPAAELIGRVRRLALERFAPGRRRTIATHVSLRRLRGPPCRGLARPLHPRAVWRTRRELRDLLSRGRALAQGNASTSLTFNMHCLTMLMMGEIADTMPLSAPTRSGTRSSAPRSSGRSSSACLLRPAAQRAGGARRDGHEALDGRASIRDDGTQGGWRLRRHRPEVLRLARRQRAVLRHAGHPCGRRTLDPAHALPASSEGRAAG